MPSVGHVVIGFIDDRGRRGFVTIDGPADTVRLLHSLIWDDVLQRIGCQKIWVDVEEYEEAD